MKYTLTYTNNYLLVVDDSEIKEGDCYLTFTNKVVMGEPRKCEDTNWNFSHCKKIIAHLPLNNSPIFKEVDLLPPLEDDVEQLAWDTPCLSRKDVYELFNDVFKDKRIEGAYSLSASKQVHQFNHRLRELAKANVVEQKAKETYKCTEEDMMECVKHILRDLNTHNETDAPVNFVWTDSFKNYIQSLNQPKLPVAFECMVQKRPMQGISNGEDINYKIKITNSEGRTEWVGKYVYAD